MQAHAQPATPPDRTAAPAAPAPAPAAATDRPLLELTRIAKVFHTDDVETRALSAVELGIARGEFVSINGPSGSGKSTLLAILGLLDVPTEGEYRIAGQDTARLDPVRRAALRNRSIGFIFQAFNLIGDEAVRVPVTFGRASVDQIEVTAGLSAGDRVILSDMARWDGHDRLRLE